MRTSAFFACLVAIATIAGGPALANTCQADDGTTCATGMPIDGYCQCHVHGMTKDGTVIPAAQQRSSRPVSRPDCRVTPQAPGCPHP